jgi:hypothetical protein
MTGSIAGSKWYVSLPFGRNLSLDILAIHPVSDDLSFHENGTRDRQSRISLTLDPGYNQP